nr:immunoglobulin light chain junction region [Macaca mulatta]MOY09989.1 immunoglobulin light chain junction region [Macaca mulatta]
DYYCMVWHNNAWVF